MTEIMLERLQAVDATDMNRLHRCAQPLDPDFLAFEFAHPETFRWIGARDGSGRLVGMHRLVFLPDLMFHRHIFVAPHERGHGVARALHRRAVEEAVAMHRGGTAAWAWDEAGERQMLGAELAMIPGSRRFIRFRIPAGSAPGGALGVEPAGSVIPEIMCSSDSELGVPPAPGNGRTGYALVTDRWGAAVGAFRYVREHRCVSIADPILDRRESWADFVEAARAWADASGVPYLDVPTPASQFFVVAPKVQQAGGKRLNRRVIGLCWRRW